MIFWKRKAHKKGFLRRVFWLFGTHYLFYAEDEDAELPSAILNLRKSSCTALKPELSGRRVNKENCMELRIPRAVCHNTSWRDRTFVLAAENAEDFAEWYRRIARASEHHESCREVRSVEALPPPPIRTTAPRQQQREKSRPRKTSKQSSEDFKGSRSKASSRPKRG